MTGRNVSQGPNDPSQSSESAASNAAAAASGGGPPVHGLADLQWPPPKDWQKFERLCHALWRRIWGDLNAQMNGRPGQQQHGVDVFGTPRGDTRFHGIQCKRKDLVLGTQLTEEEVLAEVENAKAFQPPLAELIIATCAPSDVNLQALARQITQQHATQGLFRVHVFGWGEIEARMAEHPEVIAQVYGWFSASGPAPEVTQLGRSDTQHAELVAGQLSIGQQVAQLASQFAAQLSGPSDGPAHAKLDACRELLQEHSYRAALQLLERIRDQEWDTAHSGVRFRIATNLGGAHLGLGDNTKAGEWFVQSFAYDSTSDRALANYALGLFLLDRPAEALAAARDAIEKHPLSSRSWSAFLNVVSRLDPQASMPELPVAVATDPDVLFAYADGLAMRHRWLEAEDAFRAVIALPKFDPMAKSRLAEIILTRVTGGRFYAGAPYSVTEMTRLNEARALLEETWNQVKGTDRAIGALHVVQNWCGMCAVLGQMREAETAVDEALAIAPNADGLIAWKIRMALVRGDSASAVRLLAKLTPDTTDGYALIAAQVYRAANDTRRAAAVLESYIHSSTDLELSSDARCMFADFVCQSDLAHAEERFNALPHAGTASVAFATVMFARALLEAGSKAVADRYLNIAREPLATSANARDRLMLADALAEFGQHEAAVAIYENDVSPATDTPSLREYIRCLFELDQRRRLVDLFAAIPQETRDKAYYEFTRANLSLRSGDFASARSALQRCLAIEPDNLSTRLLWAEVCIHLHDLSPARTWLDTISILNASLTVDQFLRIGRLYHALERVDSAAAAFYEGLRRFPHDPRTHLALSSSLTFKGNPAWATNINSVAGPNMTVTLRDADGKERAYVIEDREPSELHADEIAVGSELAVRLMGHKVGDTIVAHSSELATHESTVTAIEHKYVHARNASMAAFNTRFPDHPGLISIKLPASSAPETRLAPILRSVSEKAKRSQQIGATIRQGMPIAGVGTMLGCTSIEAWRGLIGRPSEPIPVCLGTKEERQTAADLIRGGRRFLIDPVALMELHLLTALGAAEATIGRLAIVQTTLDELNQMCADLDLHRDGYMTVFESGGEYYRQEVSAKAIAEDRRSIQSLLDWALAHCDVVEAIPTVDPRPETAAALSRALGQAVYDSLLAAQGGKFVLLSDDFNLRRLANEEFGLDGIWIQPLLMCATDTKRMKQHHYDRAVASLAAWRHDFTSVNAQQLLFSANRGGWKVTPEFKALVSTMPLVRSDVQTNIPVCFSFLREIWKRGKGPTRGQATKMTHAMLDGIRPDESENREAFFHALQVATARGYLPERAGRAIEEWNRAH
jgi:tetratricopeptide (TPR) repeat protein